MSRTVGVVDYGAGNLFSVETALINLGIRYVISASPDDFKEVTQLILPGVGHFGDAMEKLRAMRIDGFLKEFIAEEENKLLGICLGMQLLAEQSEEALGVSGVGIISGRVRKIQPGNNARVPHIGWNELVHLGNPPEIFGGLTDGQTVYFNHGFEVILDEDIPSVFVEYGGSQMLAAFQKGNVLGFQFHPEKSQVVGLELLGRFLGACVL